MLQFDSARWTEDGFLRSLQSDARIKQTIEVETATTQELGRRQPEDRREWRELCYLHPITSGRRRPTVNLICSIDSSHCSVAIQIGLATHPRNGYQTQ